MLFFFFMRDGKKNIFKDREVTNCLCAVSNKAEAPYFMFYSLSFIATANFSSQLPGRKLLRALFANALRPKAKRAGGGGGN